MLINLHNILKTLWIIGIFVLILILGSQYAYSQTWWTTRGSDTDLSLTDVQFVDESTVWVVGGQYQAWPDEDAVLKSIDKGETWQSVDVGFEAAYKGVYFLNENVGWIVGYYGAILKTENGGQTWVKKTSPTGSTLFKVFFIDELIGYIVGVKGIILKTIDGGENWEFQSNPLDVTRTKIRGLYFIDADTGYVVGHDRWILKTTDGGENWIQKFSVKTDEDLRYVQFIDDSTGFAIGERGIILKTEDYGETWNHLNTGSSADLWSGYFDGEGNGYAVGGLGTILITKDGGSTWEAQTTDTQLGLISIAIKNGKGVVVGESGQILVSPGPPDILNLKTVNYNNLKITFSQVSNVTEYNVYRDTEPIFIPDRENGLNRIGTFIQDENPSEDGIQWTDQNNVIGDSNTNYYYQVTAVGEWETDPSVTFGEFDYDLVAPSNSAFNAIALCLDPINYDTADSLANRIQNCNSIAFWLNNYQNYQQYATGVGASSFGLEAGQMYLVNVISAGTFTLLGKLVSPNYSLMTTAGTDWNTIMVPFSKGNITTASELLSDIPSSTSAAYFNAQSQSYIQYLAGTSVNNFEVKTGFPYFVNVGSNIGWPDNNIQKRLSLFDSNFSGPTKAPHLIWGNIHCEESIYFEAYVTSRPHEVLSINSPGSILTDSLWMIQVSDFKSAWCAGEIVHISFFSNKDNRKVGEQRVTITLEAGDKAADVNIVSDNQAEIPLKLELYNNYPNPFNGTTKIQYTLPEQSEIMIYITNTVGQTVKTLLSKNQPAGYYGLAWDGTNNLGLKVSSGIYFYHLKTQFQQFNKKMILLQ